MFTTFPRFSRSCITSQPSSRIADSRQHVLHRYSLPGPRRLGRVVQRCIRPAARAGGTVSECESSRPPTHIDHSNACWSPFPQVPNPSNGAAVTLEACNSANNNQANPTNQQWVIQEGNNQGVQLFGTDLCLDAQTDPTPGRPTVVYPCIGTGPQTWVSALFISPNSTG